LDKADIGFDDDSIDSATGIDIDLVIIIKGIGVSAFRCRAIVFAEENRSIEGDVSASTITGKSQDVTIIESEDGVSR
jgi:hypothetical protein